MMMRYPLFKVSHYACSLFFPFLTFCPGIYGTVRQADHGGVQDVPSSTTIRIDLKSTLCHIERDCDKLMLQKADLFETKKVEKRLRACKIS